MTVCIIHPDGRQELRDGALPFNEYQEIVGGTVEVVFNTLGGVAVHLLCNEDGIRLGLPVNPYATRFAETFDRGVLMPPEGMRGAVVVLTSPHLLT